MIKKLPESEGAVIGVEVSGKIDSKEENKWIEIFDKLIAEHGSINILVLLDGKFSIVSANKSAPIFPFADRTH
jgi:hypothetical protein